jgi:uncharacterized heparinase superfamily protein
MNLLRYIHTIRYLKPIQIYGRIRNLFYRAMPGHDPAPMRRQTSSIWENLSHRPAVMINPYCLSLFNRDYKISDAHDWYGRKIPRLAAYHLHYFDDFAAVDAAERKVWHQDLIAHWIDHNPPGSKPGWEPYPTSLRIVNWIKWLLQENDAAPEMLDSLALQVRSLRKRIEYHLLGNHLIANAKALVFAGAFFQGKEADEWLGAGLKLLSHEINEQILADGGHYERSPMYHSIVLEDVLDLIQLERMFPDFDRDDLCDAIEQCKDAAPRMFEWLNAMRHPDGDISFFNDTCFKQAPPPDGLTDYARQFGCIASDDQSGKQIIPLPDSGYYRLQKKEAVLLIDAGEVGPDYQPGHGHADTLSFELSLYGKRFLVNSGVSTYEDNALRNYQRSTPAHNTATVQKENSSDIWAAFRVARRATVFDVCIEEDKEWVCLKASHDGYKRFRGKVIHKRTFVMDADSLIITDEFTGSGSCDIDIYWHLHPTVDVRNELENNTEIMFSNDIISGGVLPDHKMKTVIENSKYYPGFGMEQDNSQIVTSWMGELPVSFTTKLSWGG